MATSCGFEFKAKHFWYTDVEAEKFQRIQWTPNRWIHLAYRGFMFAYTIGWLIGAYVVNTTSTVYQFISNWTEVVMNLYFLIAFLVSIYGVATRGKAPSKGPLRWFHIINWWMFNVATVAAFNVTIFYWALIGRTRTAERNLRPVTFHLHVTNSILMLIDIFMVAFPVRLLHFFYAPLYGVVYILFMLILHWTNVNSAIYAAVNWSTSPATSAGYSIAAVIVLPIVLHAIVFGLYHLRALIARRTVLKGEQSGDGATAQFGEVELGKTNAAFEPSDTPKPETDSTAM
nr:protein rolling stone-like [Ciona intestinalis]|eukprot:XP_002127130.1 protein rolling stone-like [Ciona intestinalis]